jgi:hypothetical protein
MLPSATKQKSTTVPADGMLLSARQQYFFVVRHATAITITDKVAKIEQSKHKINDDGKFICKTRNDD